MKKIKRKYFCMSRNSRLKLSMTNIQISNFEVSQPTKSLKKNDRFINYLISRLSRFPLFFRG